MNRNVKEFKINNFLSLRLEDGRTHIYVKNRRFQQCMYLLLNIPVNRVEDYDGMDSIDEIAENLDRSLEHTRDSTRHEMIAPEEEFVGHCSNLQVWTECEYDTRILHRNLALPLLKRLAEVKDPIATKKFKDEIALRYASGHPTVMTYLTNNGYLKYLDSEEIKCLLDDQNLPILEDITTQLNETLPLYSERNMVSRIKYFTKDIIRNFGTHNLPFVLFRIVKQISEEFRPKLVNFIYEQYKSKKNFPVVQYLNYHMKYIQDISFNTVSYDDKIVSLIEGHKLDLSHQKIEDITKVKGLEDEYQNIEDLDLSNNLIKKITGLENFSNLKSLNLNNNQISRIEGLKGLNFLDLSGNRNIEYISESINELYLLNTLKLHYCGLKRFSENTSKFFWSDQNYRFFLDYSEEDLYYYEKTHKGKASSHDQLYKNFVKWRLKIKSLMKEYKFSYEDIRRFEGSNDLIAIRSGRITRSFKKFLFDKNQTKITLFL
jgi:hypothetical protein